MKTTRLSRLSNLERIVDGLKEMLYNQESDWREYKFSAKIKTLKDQKEMETHFELIRQLAAILGKEPMECKPPQHDMILIDKSEDG